MAWQLYNHLQKFQSFLKHSISLGQTWALGFRAITSEPSGSHFSSIDVKRETHLLILLYMRLEIKCFCVLFEYFSILSFKYKIN